MMIVSGRAYYDAFGRTVKSYYPVTETKDVQYSTGLDDIAPSTTTYDILDRPLIQKAPDNTTTAYSYDFGTDDRNQTMFLTEITDPNTNTSQILKNVDGLQYMLQASGQAPVYFDYSLTGECIQVYGDDFSRSYAYDCLGRKTQYVEDSLKETYTYTGENLTEEDIYWNENGSPQQATITYTYDNNRIKTMQSSEYQDIVQYTYNNKGKLDTIKDASGKQIFKYGSMGEIISQTRIYTLPFMEQGVKIENKFEYDSWGRINEITYEDGEIVQYEYDYGGELKSVHGEKAGHTYNYVNDIQYDKFGSKVYEEYGNGIYTYYEYHPENLRLTNKSIYIQQGGQMYVNPSVSYTYDYDNKGNITEINTTSSGSGAGFGTPGSSNSNFYLYIPDETFTYDASDQLIQAEGNSGNTYTLNVNYGNYGRINTYNTYLKNPQINVVQQQSNSFSYPSIDIPSTSFAPEENNDSILYRYGINGSLRMKETPQRTEYYLFNAFNQMKAYSDNGESYGYYAYDANGERIYKLQLNTVSSNTNTYPNSKTLEVEKITLYPNGYININQDGEYTKHYYAGNQRIASKIGGGFNESLSDTTAQNGDALATMKRELGEVVIPHDTVEGIEYSFGQITHLQGNSGQIEDGLFFYHANHLGSTQMVTDINADVTQQILYAPFGEVISEYNAYWHQGKIPDYMFNAKELDEENGMYYYEARYYNPPTFISRDPLFEKKPWLNPYAYCANNPINKIDPTGLLDDWVENANGEVYWDENATSQETTKEGERYLGKEGFGINATTGTAVHYKPDGTTSESVLSCSDVSVSPNAVYSTENPSSSSNNRTGYIWDKRDLAVWNELKDSKSPIGTVIRKQLETGNFGILSATNYWNEYGYTLGHLIVMKEFIDMVAGLTPGAGGMPKIKGGGYRGGMTPSTPNTSKTSSSSSTYTHYQWYSNSTNGQIIIK